MGSRRSWVCALPFLGVFALGGGGCSLPLAPPAARTVSPYAAQLPTPQSDPSPGLADAGFACPVFDPVGTTQHVRNALEPLMAGDEDAARTELRLALCQDPEDPTARSLLRQLAVDPEEVLGGEFFCYTVRAGDSLPRIAKEFLDDPYQFYLLSRYNDLAAPDRLRVGQCLKIPGASPAGQKLDDQLYRCGLAELEAGETKAAYAFFRDAVRLDPAQELARAKMGELTPAMVEIYRSEAVSALRQQRYGPAAAASRKMLECDPDNARARELLTEADGMQTRLAGLLCDEAEAALARDDRAEALADADKALELDPGHSRARELRARASGPRP